MLIKRSEPEALWIVCTKCGTPMRPKSGGCKCGNVSIKGDASKGEPVEIEADESDEIVYDNS